MMRSRSFAWLLAGMGMAGQLAIDAYLPAIPAIGQTFGVSPLLAQQTLSAYLFPFALMMLFHGTLSDSFGRRPVVLVSLLVYICASFGAALATDFHWLLACRALQGLAAGAGSVVGQAIIRDRYDGAQAQRMLSHVMMVFGLAPALAPVLGGWLHASFGWRSVFLFLGAFGAAMLWICYRALPESLPKPSRQPFHAVAIMRQYASVLRHPRFLLLTAAAGMLMSGFSLYIGAAASFVMDILHLPETGFGWLFIPVVCGMALGAVLAGHYAERCPPKVLMLLGYAIVLAAGLINVAYNLFFSAALPWAVLPLMLYAAGIAVVNPALTVIALDIFPQNRGMASSVLAFLEMLIFALVSGLVAPLLFGSAMKLAAGMLVGLVMSVVFWLGTQLRHNYRYFAI